MGKKKKIKGLNEGHYVEATDRTYIIANMVDEYLFEHPVVQKHKELRKRIKKARILLLETYQIIAGLEIKEFPDPAQQADKK